MKFMNLKRFGSVAMAGALAMSLTAPAFASGSGSTTTDLPSNQKGIDITGTYAETPIDVTVPATGTAQINPYGLPYTITKGDESTVQITDQQITSAPLNIRNNGNYPMDVTASLKVVPTGDVIVKKAALSSAEKGKEINVTLEVAGLNSDDLKVSAEDETLEDKLIDEFVKDETWASLTAASKLVAEDAAKGAAESAITAAKSTGAMVTLGAATVTEDAITYGPKSIALVRLTGKVNEAPNDGTANPADTPWASGDGFTAKVVFTFKPAAKVAITWDTNTGATDVVVPAKAYEGETVNVSFKATTGKTITATIDSKTVNFTEGSGDNAGTYTGSFVMPATAVTITLSGL